MIPLHTLLVAVDPSDPCPYVLPQALAFAAAMRASLHVLTVVSEPLHEPWTGYAPGPSLVDELDRERAAAQTRVERLVPRRALRDGRITVMTAWGEPAEEIVRYARRHQADVIICGTHGRRGVDRLLMGSVAEQLLRTAPCPVLTVRDPNPTAVAA